jgi:hypothetical protein
MAVYPGDDTDPTGAHGIDLVASKIAARDFGPGYEAAWICPMGCRIPIGGRDREIVREAHKLAHGAVAQSEIVRLERLRDLTLARAKGAA